MSLVSDLLELVYPARCVHCGASGGAWCPRCSAVGDPFSASTGAKLPVFAAGVYDASLRSALLAYKERRTVALAPALASHLRAVLEKAEAEGVDTAVLVPVPSSRSSARARGGDHVERLARLVAVRTGRVVRRPVTLSRRVADSAGLNADERRANLAGSMFARRPAASEPTEVVLVDDIATTGATLIETQRALRFAGWRPVAAVVVAATPRRDDGTQHAHIGLTD